MQAVIIVIGDEILSGNTVDTNSAFITSKLRMAGFNTVRIFTVPDETETIVATFKTAWDLAEVIITTGGLGPTSDDKTVPALRAFFNDNYRTDEATLQHLKKLLAERGRPELFDINKSQAEVLSSAVILQNDLGTAPCQLIEKEGKTVLCLPGVPLEMKNLVTSKVIPFLSAKYKTHHLLSRTVTVVNIPESRLAQMLTNWENQLPAEVKLSYLPMGSRIKLRLSDSGPSEADIITTFDNQTATLRPILGNHIISERAETVEEIIKDLLAAHHLTISTAESCTGGQIARLITDVPGSSQVFLGGVVPYDSLQKVKLLQVKQEDIDTHTVVSEEVAQQMSKGCQQLFKTDIAVATTGVAGPAADAHGNTVGTVYYSVRFRDKELTKRLFLPYLERSDFMNFVAQRALQTVVEMVLEETRI